MPCSSQLLGNRRKVEVLGVLAHQQLVRFVQPAALPELRVQHLRPSAGVMRQCMSSWERGLGLPLLACSIGPPVDLLRDGFPVIAHIRDQFAQLHVLIYRPATNFHFGIECVSPTVLDLLRQAVRQVLGADARPFHAQRTYALAEEDVLICCPISAVGDRTAHLGSGLRGVGRDEGWLTEMKRCPAICQGSESPNT